MCQRSVKRRNTIGQSRLKISYVTTTSGRLHVRRIVKPPSRAPKPLAKVRPRALAFAFRQPPVTSTFSMGTFFCLMWREKGEKIKKKYFLKNGNQCILEKKYISKT